MPARFTASFTAIAPSSAADSPESAPWNDPIGVRQARRLMLTGERITAAEAARIGLVHEVVPADQLDGAIAALLDHLLKGGPQALAAAKRLVHDLAGRPIASELIDDTAARIAALRATPEAREGVAAFLAKRPPGWLA